METIKIDGKKGSVLVSKDWIYRNAGRIEWVSCRHEDEQRCSIAVACRGCVFFPETFASRQEMWSYLKMISTLVNQGVRVSFDAEVSKWVGADAWEISLKSFFAFSKARKIQEPDGKALEHHSRHLQSLLVASMLMGVTSLSRRR